MKLLSDIYDVPTRKRIRGAAKYDWVRPTIKHFLTATPKFRYIEDISTYFGEGTDGDLITTGNVSFSSTLDGPTVYKHFNNLVINEGHVVTVANRCKGMVIYCDGDCTINGTLSMTARGCKGAGEYFAPNGLASVKTPDGTIDLTIPPTGGTVTGNPRSSSYSYYNNYYNGNSSTNGACGGGGSGGASNSSAENGRSPATGGAGGAGTTWCGGSGGGGCGADRYEVTASNGSSSGGAGGAGYGYDAVGAGGAGNPGGTGHYRRPNSYSTYDWPGNNGAGGLLILAVKGTLTINGSVQSKGSDGGTIPTGRSYSSGGGGSGGGSITILHCGSFTNNGTISVSGGAGGGTNGRSNCSPGGAGGSGSLRIHKVL